MVIEIKTDKPYEVIVEDGVLDRAGEKIAPLVMQDEPEVPDDSKCPECGKPLAFEGGCNICRSCGYSKCG